MRGAHITVADLGEFGLIAAMKALLPVGAAQLVGIGDDAAVLRAPDARVVATMDLLVEGRHFRRAWSAAFDVGCKAAAQNLADIAAMGAVPTALLVGFAAPGDLPMQWARDFVRGLAQESARGGASVVGGDVSSADAILIAITALGDLSGRNPVTRSGARPGDKLAVAGTLGRSAAGLALLEAGLAEPAALIAAHQRPRPPYDAGPQAALLGASSMIDISDGLVQDLGHVAAASGVRIDIDSTRLARDPQFVAAAAALRTARDDAARGGAARGGAARGDAARGETAMGGSGRGGAGPGGEEPAGAGPGGEEPAGAGPGGEEPAGAGSGGVGPGSGSLDDGGLDDGGLDDGGRRDAGWLGWMLTGGEDHALAATFPAGTQLPERWSVIGTVAAGRGVRVDGESSRAHSGWDHFR